MYLQIILRIYGIFNDIVEKIVTLAKDTIKNDNI